MSENKKQIKCNLSVGGNTQYEIANSNEEKKHILKGYALLFNTPTDYYDNGKMVKATIADTALDNTNLNGRIFCLHQHKWDEPLGVTGVNLELSVEKPRTDFCGGLFYKIELDDEPLDKYVAKRVRKGILADCSFSALVERELDDNGNLIFTNIVELDEVSIVTRGQFAEPSVIVAQKQDVKVAKPEVKDKDGNSQFNKLLEKIKEI